MAKETFDPVDEAYIAGLWAGIRLVEGRNYQRLSEYNLDVIGAAVKYRGSPDRARCESPKPLNLNEQTPRGFLTPIYDDEDNEVAL